MTSRVFVASRHLAWLGDAPSRPLQQIRDYGKLDIFILQRPLDRGKQNTNCAAALSSAVAGLSDLFDYGTDQSRAIFHGHSHAQRQ